MKTKHLVIIGALGALLIAYIVSIVPNFCDRAERNRTVAALKALSYERVVQKGSVPHFRKSNAESAIMQD